MSASRDRRGEPVEQRRLDRGGDRVAGLVVDPDHLLRVPVLGPADVPLLERRRPVVERRSPSGRRSPASASSRRTRSASASLPTPPIRRTSAPRARSIVATLAAPPSRCSRWSARSKRHRRFLADPLGVAPDVAVEDQVADDEDAGVPQRRDASDQVVGHAGSSLTSRAYAGRRA